MPHFPKLLNTCYLNLWPYYSLCNADSTINMPKACGGEGHPLAKGALGVVKLTDQVSSDHSFFTSQSQAPLFLDPARACCLRINVCAFNISSLGPKLLSDKKADSKTVCTCVWACLCVCVCVCVRKRMFVCVCIYACLSMMCVHASAWMLMHISTCLGSIISFSLF